MKIAIGFCAALIGVGAVLAAENFFGVDINLVRDEPISASIENLEEGAPEITIPKPNSKKPVVKVRRSKGSYVAKKLNNSEREELEKKVEQANLDAKRRYDLIQSGSLADNEEFNQTQQR